MTDIASKLHDAVLVAIVFDLPKGVCEFKFLGAPAIPGPFTLVFDHVKGLRATHEELWGFSASVLELKKVEGGWYEFHMQSGDIVSVRSLDFSFQQA